MFYVLNFLFYNTFFRFRLHQYKKITSNTVYRGEHRGGGEEGDAAAASLKLETNENTKKEKEKEKEGEERRKKDNFGTNNGGF